MLQETLITFFFLTLDTSSSKTLSFLLQSLNGTTGILPSRTQKVKKKKNPIIGLRVGLIHLREHIFKHNF